MNSWRLRKCTHSPRQCVQPAYTASTVIEQSRFASEIHEAGRSFVERVNKLDSVVLFASSPNPSPSPSRDMHATRRRVDVPCWRRGESWRQKLPVLLFVGPLVHQWTDWSSVDDLEGRRTRAGSSTAKAHCHVIPTTATYTKPA